MRLGDSFYCYAYKVHKAISLAFEVKLMVSTYILHIIKSLHYCKGLDVAQLAHILETDEATCSRLLHHNNLVHEGESELTIANVDRLVDFLGMGVFTTSFTKELLNPSNNNAGWESSSEESRRLVNYGTIWASARHSDAPMAVMGYLRQCQDFLSTCEGMVEVIKTSEAEEELVGAEVEEELVGAIK